MDQGQVARRTCRCWALLDPGRLIAPKVAAYSNGVQLPTGSRLNQRSIADVVDVLTVGQLVSLANVPALNISIKIG